MAAHRVIRRRDAGFTMVEVMVAILLTSIAVIGVVGLFRVETRASGFSRHATEAAVLAQDRLEYLRTQVAPLAGTNTESTLNDVGTTSPPGRYTRTSVVSASGDVFSIEVTVSWEEDGAGTANTRSVVVVGQRGGS